MGKASEGTGGGSRADKQRRHPLEEVITVKDCCKYVTGRQVCNDAITLNCLSAGFHLCFVQLASCSYLNTKRKTM